MPAVNDAYFTNATSAVNACQNCEDLQRVVDQVYGTLAPAYDEMATILSAITPLLTPPGLSLGSIVTWITNYISLLQGPATKLAAQQAAFLAKVTSLSAAITAKAATLGGSCSVTIPPL